MRYIFCSILLLVTLNGCKDKSTNPPPPALVYDTTSHNLSWVADTLGDYELNDVWGTDANNIYGVGRVALHGQGFDSSRCVIRWTGTQWVYVPDIALGQRYDLANYATAIYGFGQNDFWVAKASIPNSYDTLGYPITHFDGQQWKTYHAPPPTPFDPIGYINDVRAMWGSDPQHLWAVGDSGLVYFWNGSVWTKQQTPQAAYDTQLISVHGFSSTEVYACGMSVSINQGIILKYDGTSWKTMALGFPFPDENHIDNSLQGIYCGKWQMGNITEQRIWVVGLNIYAWDKVMYPDSVHWKRVLVPSSRRYAGINGDGGGNVFLGGIYGAFAHWNGVSWKEYPQVTIGTSSQFGMYHSYVKGKDVMFVGRTISSFSNAVYLKGKLQ
jgi:hypothetical protein